MINDFVDASQFGFPDNFAAREVGVLLLYKATYSVCLYIRLCVAHLFKAACNKPLYNVVSQLNKAKCGILCNV